MSAIRAYWFEPADGVLGHNDGRKPVAGETHEVIGPPRICEHGLHGSVRAIDALRYAQSNVIWIVDLNGEVIQDNDKCCSTSRTYIHRIDIRDVLFECACSFALSVAHLWDIPPLVRQFLETGDKSLRAAAGSAALAAALAAAWAAARDAALAAALAAAWAAARDAALAAALAAAGAAAGSAAWAAARDAARDAQNVLLETLIQRKLDLKAEATK